MVQVFAIEGPDGVGKTTLIKYLKNEFSRYCLWLNYTAQPSGEYRKKLIDTDLSILEQIAVVKESRLDILAKVDDVLITDRWDASAFIYQALRNDRKDLLLNIDRDVMLERKICNYEVNYIYMDIPPLTSFSRIFNDDRQNNKFDSIKFDQHVELCNNYKDLFSNVYNLDSIRSVNIFSYKGDEDNQTLVNWIRNKIKKDKTTFTVEKIKLQVKFPSKLITDRANEILTDMGNILNEKGFIYTFSTFLNEPKEFTYKNTYIDNAYDILSKNKELSTKSVDDLFNTVFFSSLYNKYFNNVKMIPVYKYNNAFFSIFGQLIDSLEDSSDVKIDIRINFRYNKHDHMVFANLTNRGVENLSWSKTKAR